MDISSVSQKIYNTVSTAESILLVIHPRPDADALGSLAAFAEWLEKISKRYCSFCRQLPANNLSFIYDLEALITQPSQILKEEFDLMIVFDSGDLKYAGIDDLFASLTKKPKIVNIDHHITNDFFGDINLVDATAASTTQILFGFFRALKIPISPSASSALLAGIIGDTYNFTNPNTTQESLMVAAKLLVKGAKLNAINNVVLKNKNIDDLKVWGKALIRLRTNVEFNIATTVITHEDLQDSSVAMDIIDGIANFLNSLTGVEATLILRQDIDGYIKGSFRTNSDLIDVSQLAKMLGGGGHRKAAGFRVRGKLSRAREGYWQII